MTAESANQKAVIDSAAQAGTDSPIVFVYIEKASADELKKQIIRSESAPSGTIDFKGVPSTPEGEEARNAMQSRLTDANRNRDELIAKIVDGAKVYKGGGTEQFELALPDKVRTAADGAGSTLPELQRRRSQELAGRDHTRCGDRRAVGSGRMDGADPATSGLQRGDANDRLRDGRQSHPQGV